MIYTYLPTNEQRLKNTMIENILVKRILLFLIDRHQSLDRCQNLKRCKFVKRSKFGNMTHQVVLEGLGIEYPADMVQNVIYEETTSL